MEPTRKNVLAGAALAAALGLVLLVSVAWGFRASTWANFVANVVGEPWGIVTLIDLYVGFVFAGAWTWAVVRRKALVPLWWVALFFTGNLAVVALLLVRARCAEGFTAWLTKPM